MSRRGAHRRGWGAARRHRGGGGGRGSARGQCAGRERGRRQRGGHRADDGEAPGSVAADAGERDARLCRCLDGVGAERDGACRSRAVAAVGGIGAADAHRRRACTRAGAGIARRRPAQGRGRLPRWQRRRERRLAAGRRQRRPVRNRRAGGDGRPPERHHGATGKVQADQRALSAAQATLTQGEASAATYGQNAVYTMLPKVGQIVRRGEPLYAIGGEPAFLLYGGVPASRAFMPGMSAGADVAELNRNLRGYGAPSGDAFTAATTLAIERFQSAHHVPATGSVPARLSGVRAGRGPGDERHADGGFAGAGRAGARDHLDSSRGDDRPRRVAAVEHQGGRPGASSRFRTTRPRRGTSPSSARWRRPRPTTTATGRARRRSRWT